MASYNRQTLPNSQRALISTLKSLFRHVIQRYTVGLAEAARSNLDQKTAVKASISSTYHTVYKLIYSIGCVLHNKEVEEASYIEQHEAEATWDCSSSE